VFWTHEITYLIVWQKYGDQTETHKKIKNRRFVN